MFKLQISSIFNFDWAHQSWISGLLGVKYLNIVNFSDNENSSDEGRAKKKRGRDSSASSNSDSGFLGKKSNKKRSKDDDPLSLNTREKKLKLPRKNIALLSEHEIRDRYRYKKHTCQLSDLPTKTKVIHLKVWFCETSLFTYIVH